MNYFLELLITLPAILIAITVHEFFHAYTAVKMGDRTPEYYGRLSLNPMHHLDLLGTLMLIFAHFGWAKPVPINPNNFRDYNKGIILVSIAGPLSNIGMALIASFFYKPIAHIGNPYLIDFFGFFILINVVLAIFNMLPIPPLDGSRLLTTFLPSKYDNITRFLERYGIFIIIIIVLSDRYTGILSGFFNAVVYPIVNFLINLMPW